MKPMETNEVIPNLQPTAAEIRDPATTPGRGGPGLAPGGEGGAASGGQPEDFEQRGFAHGESELATVTGLPPDALKKIRQKKLRQGIDWAVNAGLRVVYSVPGFTKLLELASGSKVKDGKIAGVPITEIEAKSRTVKPEDKLTGKLTRLFPNPYLIEVELPDKKRVLVRVKTTVNFRRGMEVPIRPRPGSNGVYDLARRCPRFPGKW